MNKTKKREKRRDSVDGEIEDDLNLLRKLLLIFLNETKTSDYWVATQCCNGRKNKNKGLLMCRTRRLGPYEIQQGDRSKSYLKLGYQYLRPIKNKNKNFFLGWSGSPLMYSRLVK